MRDEKISAEGADDLDQLGARLSNLRAKYGYSLREVERRSDGLVRSSHLSQVESGKVASPSLSFLRELARVFEMSLGDLLLELGLATLPSDIGPRSPQQVLALAHMSEMSPAEQSRAVEFMEFMLSRGGEDAVRPER